MTRFYLIRISRAESMLIGPFQTASDQTRAASLARDEVLLAGDQMLWLDITDGVPSVGGFDPQFWQESETSRRDLAN